MSVSGHLRMCIYVLLIVQVCMFCVCPCVLVRVQGVSVLGAGTWLAVRAHVGFSVVSVHL